MTDTSKWPPHEPDARRTGNPVHWCERCRLEAAAVYGDAPASPPRVPDDRLLIEMGKHLRWYGDDVLIYGRSVRDRTMDALNTPPVPPTPEVVEAAIDRYGDARRSLEKCTDVAAAASWALAVKEARAALLALYVPPSVRAEDIEWLVEGVAMLDEKAPKVGLTPKEEALRDRMLRFLTALTPRPTPETRDNG